MKKIAVRKERATIGFFVPSFSKVFFLLNIILVLAVSTFSGFAQTQTDSLNLSKVENIIATFDSRDTVSAISYCKELEILTFSISDTLYKAEASRLAGIIYYRIGFFNDAFLWFDKAINSTNQINNSKAELIRAKALSNKGELFYQGGDFKEALNCYLEAEKLYYINNKIDGLITIYSAMGSLYDKILQPEKREQINDKAFSLVEFTNDTVSKIKAYTAKANNLSNENKFQEAIQYYQITLVLAQNIHNKSLEHVAFYDLGFTYSRMEDYQKAIEMYGKSLDAAKQAGNLIDTGDALYKLGLMYYYSKNLEKSREILAEAMKIADLINSNILRRNIYDVLYSVEETDNNFKKAYEYLNKYVDVEFEIFSEEDQRQVNFLKAAFDTEKREFQITKLEAEKEIQKLKLNKQRWFIFSLLMILLFVLLFTVFIIRHNLYKQKLSEKQKLLGEQKISELEKEQQLLVAKTLLQGEEKERTRIATDLHDGLGGLLSGVKINLSHMKESAYLTEEQVSLFNEVLLRIDTSMMELRRIAHNMTPETLYNYGLKIAFYDFCIGVSSKGSPEITFNFFGEEIRLSRELELSFYRIGQELINNAIKHAGASVINLQLFGEKNRIALQVFDNGCGFEPDKVKNSSKGQGLLNIKNRVSAFGGKFEINSQPGQGTEIFIEYEFSNV